MSVDAEAVRARPRPVAWVTGASRGMGADTSVQLARAGYDVALTARDQRRLDEVADEVRAEGGRALAVASDLTDRGSIVCVRRRGVDGVRRL